MGWAERLRGAAPDGAEPADAGERDFELRSQLKAELHAALVERLDFATIEKLSAEELRPELRKLLAQMVDARELPLSRLDRERVISDLLDEVTGLGPLERLLADPTVTDILINTHQTVYVERHGKLERAEQVRFRDEEHLLHVINRIVSRIGRRCDEASPMVDARLPDGSRVNAIIPPLAVDGPLVSIRRFGARPLRMPDLLANATLTEEMAAFVGGCVRARLNLLISGGTGTGKTTLLNSLSAMIPPDERIVTIEDAAELQLQQPHVCRLETRPPNIEGRGEIVARDLVRNALRMRPDRIIVGEVRGPEVLDMLQAMNTGHEGSMTTVHANSPRDAINRVASMIGMAGISLSEHATAHMLARAFHLVVHVQRTADGRRRITSIAELTGVEGSGRDAAIVTMHDVFTFRQTGIAHDGRVLGEFAGLRGPCSLDRLERAGVHLPPETFAWRRQA